MQYCFSQELIVSTFFEAIIDRGCGLGHAVADSPLFARIGGLAQRLCQTTGYGLEPFFSVTAHGWRDCHAEDSKKIGPSHNHCSGMVLSSRGTGGRRSFVTLIVVARVFGFGVRMLAEPEEIRE